MKPDKRKTYKYRGIIINPQPPRGLLHRHWKIDFEGFGWLIVDTKREAKLVINAIRHVGIQLVMGTT